jgi:hypothetical protein
MEACSLARVIWFFDWTVQESLFLLLISSAVIVTDLLILYVDGLKKHLNWKPVRWLILGETILAIIQVAILLDGMNPDFSDIKGFIPSLVIQFISIMIRIIAYFETKRE